MRATQRAEMAAGLLIIALTAVATGVSAEPGLPSGMPMAITQPIGPLGTDLLTRDGSVLPEPGLLMLVGTGLMGLAAILGRSTRT